MSVAHKNPSNTPPSPPRTPNLIRKTPSRAQDKKQGQNQKPDQKKKPGSRHPRVKIKRFSEYESYSSRSRGTLGGFLPLCDVDGGADSPNPSKEGLKGGEKECILTQVTKKIGLGIYTRSRSDVAARDPENEDGRGLDDGDGDERETWYMFYPPPPSPSLDLAPREWNSGSDFDHDLDTEDEREDEEDTHSHDERYAASNRGGLCPTPHRSWSPVDNANPEADKPAVDSPSIGIDALTSSAEFLAQQYQELVISRTSTPVPTTIHPLPLQSNPYITEPAPTPAVPPTIRKIPRQHSLRKLISTSDPTPKANPNQKPPTPSLVSSTTFITPATHTSLPTPPPPTLPAMKERKPKISKMKEAPKPPPRESSRGRPAVAAVEATMTKMLQDRRERRSPPFVQERRDSAIETADGWREYENENRNGDRILLPQLRVLPWEDNRDNENEKNENNDDDKGDVKNTLEEQVLPSWRLKKQWAEAFHPGCHDEKATCKRETRRYGIVGGVEDEGAEWV